MSLEVVVAAALFVGVIAYAVFGGADFGSGFFDLTAGGSRRGAELRTLVDHSIGPVWEANHVWLIYVLVIWWTGVPRVVRRRDDDAGPAAAARAARIVLRGASFAFRKYSATLGQARLFGVVFAGPRSSRRSSSAPSPAPSRPVGCRPTARGDRWSSWLNPTSLFGGVIAVGTCAFLAGVFLTADAEPQRPARGSPRSCGRGRSSWAWSTGAVVFAALVPVLRDAPVLSARARPAGRRRSSSLSGDRRRRHARAARATPLPGRALAGRGRGRVGGLGLGRRPVPVAARRRGDDRRRRRCVRDPGGLLVAVGLAVVVVVPPLAYLLRLTQSEAWTRH